MRQELLYNYFYKKAYIKNAPVSVMIELLTQCNLKCKHCYLPAHDNIGISFEKIESLFHELRDLGVVNISLTGGEIFLREDIFDIIELARKLQMRVFLLSNGTLLNEMKVERLERLFISEFSTTVFSINDEIHDNITERKGSLKAVLENLDLLKKHNIKVKVKTPLMNLNSHEFDNINKYCQEKKFDFLASPLIFPKPDGNDSPKQLRMSEECLFQILKKIDEQNSNTHIHKYDVPCAALFYSFSIDCNGDVFPCNSLYYKVGNIYDSTIKDIWFESEELKYIKSIRNSDLETCTNCEYASNCYRCPGMALLENKNIYACDTFARLLAQVRINNYRYK